MNTIIEILNRLGDSYLEFAWPMFWQSSVLIALVCLLDLALARKVRASVRHALWLVVLVKLVLPPALAFPTGAAWWLFPQRPPQPMTASGNYVITQGDAATLPADSARTLSVPPPRPQLNRAGWCFLLCTAVGGTLLVGLGFRWWQLARRVRLSSAGQEFGAALSQARHRAGLQPGVRLKLVEAPMSPAVCGLFHPVILLPRLLIERLSADQLHAVLLHESAHLRRKDIWVNCAQSVLQILYWWHPLVWLANARIRHVREQAVDDAVMVALAGNAETYAPTLLEVARLALHRPRLSLGLVGIVESRSSLRQRIERLVNFPPLRKPGLTLVSICGIFAFSAMALPMGQPQPPAEPGTAPAPVVSPQTIATPPSNPVPVLVTAAIYQMSPDDFSRVVSHLCFHAGPTDDAGWWSASSEEYSQRLGDLKNSGLTPRLRPRVLISSGKAADLFIGNEASKMELGCLPITTGETVGLSIHGDIVNHSKHLAVTNSFSVNAAIPNRGGLVFRVPHDMSNTVCLLSVEIITNGSPRFEQRLVPIVRPPPPATPFRPSKAL